MWWFYLPYNLWSAARHESYGALYLLAIIIRGAGWAAWHTNRLRLEEQERKERQLVWSRNLAASAVEWARQGIIKTGIDWYDNQQAEWKEHVLAHIEETIRRS